MIEKLNRLLVTFLTLFSTLSGSAQSFNYRQYDTRDGLAGSTIYEMCQDKLGFIWFATENGLSRYDGTNFKTFTVADGLPDNEVLKVFADSKGRVWIGTFSKELCYFLDGRIYNKKNSSLLKDHRLNMQSQNFFEDSDGDILITDYKKIISVTPEDLVVEITDLPDVQKHKFKNVAANPFYYGRGFLVSFNDTIFRYVDEKLYLFELEKPKPGNSKFFPRHFKSRQLPEKNRVDISIPADIITTTYWKGTPVYQSTIDGAWSVDTINNKLDQHFLPGKKITRTLVDNEQNIWFATLGDGVFKLASTQMQTIGFSKSSHISGNQVYTLAPYQQDVVAGLGASKVAYIEKNVLVKAKDFSVETKRSANSNAANRIYCSYTDNSGRVFIGSDAFLAKLGNSEIVNNRLLAIKSIENIDSDHIAVGTYANAIKVRKDNLQVVDTIWNGRCTEVYFDNSNYLVGTLEGLYSVDQKMKPTYLGKLHPALKRKISDIKTDNNGNTFIATIDMGLVVLRDGKFSYWLNDENGISSNSCKCMFIDKKSLWLGTSNGVNKIDLQDFKNVIRYGTSDGLPSGNISCIYKKDSVVWVGSPAGLTYFNEATVASTSGCRLNLSVFCSGKMTAPNQYELSYRSPQINFEYVGITFRSGGDIEYYYRMLGLDDSFQVTRQNSLSFPALQPSKYTFELYAVNKFGVKSEMQRVDFSISRPFWKSSWFYLFIVICVIMLTAYLVNSRSAILKARLLEKERYHKQLIELEQQALQAQMNPQFIFTSLNSIQNYIQLNEKRKANEFLTKFAYLIRQTLDISAKTKISIVEAIQYLQSYLEMEILKGEVNLIYTIKVDSALQTELFEIPPLILQPYAADAIKRYSECKGQSKLELYLHFILDNDIIRCTIRDNISCHDANNSVEQANGKGPLKGIFLAKKRIDLLNEISETKIEVDVNEFTGENDISGTEVNIRIPIILYAKPD